MANPTALGDVLLGLATGGAAAALPYMLVPGGHHREESFRTRPNPPSQPRSLSSFEHQNNWRYFGQDLWSGMNAPRFDNAGGFKDAYGIAIGTDGSISIAKALTAVGTIIADTKGYVMFRVGFGAEWGAISDRIVVCCKSRSLNGHVYTIRVSDGSVQDFGNFGGVTDRAVASAMFYDNGWYVGDTDGHIWSVNFTAVTGALSGFTDKGRYGAETDVHDVMLLGVLGRTLFYGVNHVTSGSALLPHVYTWSSESGLFDKPFASLSDQAFVAGTNGAGGLFIVTRGAHCRIFAIRDNGTLATVRYTASQLATIGTSFLPKRALYFDKLYLLGGEYEDLLAGSTPAGIVFSYDGAALEQVFKFGTGLRNQTINDAIQELEQILWCASGGDLTSFSSGNPVAGFGIFDPTRITSSATDGDPGWYVSGITTALANPIADGIAKSGSTVFVGIRSSGVYKQTTPGEYKVQGGLYGADQRNIGKLWGQAEVHHSAKVAGQTVNLKTTKDPGDAEEAWDYSAGVSTTKLSFFDYPGTLRTPYLSYVVQGTANGSDLTLFDVALAYIPMADPDKVRREWTLKIDVSGSAAAPRKYRDGTEDARIWSTLYTALDALWNQEVFFQDVDGHEYTCLFKDPMTTPAADRPTMFHPGELDRVVSGASVLNLSTIYEVHLVES